MEESIKDRIIIILVILCAIFFVATIRSCGTAVKLKAVTAELDKEKAASWDAEQKLNELKNENSAALQEAQSSKEEFESVKNALSQEQLVSQGLKDELEKVTQLKNKLEEDLKEALVENKAKSKR
ncbi:MAG: hypothetical protein WC301_04710 [Candidatus Omnitrophota bacterium]|jgi:biopolymer transport protein ExbD